MLPALLSAEPVGLRKALRQAEAIVGKPMSRLQAPATRASEAAEPPYYIFAATDGEGFCIVAADDSLPAILGYSHEARVSAVEDMPEALKLYLLNAVALERPDASTPQAAQASEVAPLCPTQWGQDKPYNTLCPQKAGRRCPTGCVATALAQIMYRWKWPIQGKGYSWAKDGNGETYSGTLEHIYNWDAMRATTGENQNDSAAAEAVATLLYDCGLSVNMNYDTDGSGAITPSKALSANFGYVASTLRTHHRDCYSSSEWLAMIKHELDNGRPIYYAAMSSINGSDNGMGHAFIIDGYDVADNVHVNWGWDGTWDGFFPLARLNPGNNLFDLKQQMTVGIIPARNGETGTLLEFPYVSEPLKCSVSTSMQKTQAFTVTVGQVSNPNANAHTWQLSIGIFDTSGQMLGEVKSGPTPSVSLNPGYISGSQTNISCKLKDSYPDGLYALRLIFREAGTDEWQLPDMVGGFTKNGIYIKIAGKRVTFSDGAEYIAVGVRDIPQQDVSTRADETLTRVYDTAGRLVYSAPTRSFDLWEVPVHGILMIHQGQRTQKVVR